MNMQHHTTHVPEYLVPAPATAGTTVVPRAGAPVRTRYGTVAKEEKEEEEEEEEEGLK